MNIKELLLLIITMLLPVVPNQLRGHSVYADEEEQGTLQEYSDTDSLLSETAKELMHAYDFLDMLKKRSEEVAQTSIVPEMETELPQNLDHIRQPVRKKLINVLSATRFSNAKKHLKDCKEAITALEQYLQTLENITNEQQNRRARAPLAYVPRSRMTSPKKLALRKKNTPVAPVAETDGFNELAATYDLDNNENAPTPNQTTPPATVSTPIETTKPTIPVIPIALTEPIKPLIPTPTPTSTNPVEPVKPVEPAVSTKATPLTPAIITSKTLAPEPIKPSTPTPTPTPVPAAPVTSALPITPTKTIPAPVVTPAPAVIPAPVVVTTSTK